MAASVASQRASGLHRPQAAVARPTCPPTTRAPLASPSSSTSSSGSSTCSRRSSSRLYARRPRDPIVAPVIQMGPHGEEVVDLYGHLLRNRIIFLNQPVNDQVATQVVASLLALDTLEPGEEIKLYINCSAGTPYAVVSILDTIRAIKSPVSTVAMGIVAGAPVSVLATGSKGRRFAMPSTRIVLQQPMSGLQGSADECNITATEANRNMRVLYRFLSEATGLTQEQVEQECDREQFCSPQRAVELGLIDGIVECGP